jgi:hypothetical protein
MALRQSFRLGGLTVSAYQGPSTYITLEINVPFLNRRLKKLDEGGRSVAALKFETAIATFLYVILKNP